MVAAKTKTAWHSGLSTIICIGETQAERRARSGTTAVAYEPLWALGTGRVPTSAEITEVHLHIETCLTARAGAKGTAIRILYGGSVTPDNAHEF